MRLADIRELISKSAPDDWRRLTGERTAHPVRDGHHTLCVHREDVRVSIAHGAEALTNMEPDWLETFQRHLTPDRWQPYTYDYADVYWDGALVDRHLIVAVDSGSATLPVPNARYDHDLPGDPNPIRRLEVSSFHRDLARLIHSFTFRREDFDSHFRRLGAEVVDEEH